MKGSCYSTVKLRFVSCSSLFLVAHLYVTWITLYFMVILYNFNQNYYLRIVFPGVGFWNCYKLENGFCIDRNISPFKKYKLCCLNIDVF